MFELKLEGSGILRDGRVLNYDGECNYGMGTCFKTLALDQHPLGAGVQGRPLVPFRSIAVDPRFIPIGATVYVPELVGVLLPDGTRHDGCLRADDMGGAIKEHKLDFFVESYNNFKFIADNLWWRMKATPTLEEPRCAYLKPARRRTSATTTTATGSRSTSGSSSGAGGEAGAAQDGAQSRHGQGVAGCTTRARTPRARSALARKK